MKSLIIWISVLLLCGSATAQDMEPTLTRAAGNLAAKIGQVLPALDPVPGALVLVPERGTDPAVVGALATALADDGYRVMIGRSSVVEGRVLGIRIATDARSTPARIALELEGTETPRLVCLHADATWLEAVPQGAIQVEGPFRVDREAAVEAAFDQAWVRFKARLPSEAASDVGPTVLHTSPRRLIVTHASAPGGRKVYRAHLQVLPDARVLHNLERRAMHIRDSRFWKPWKRAGVLLVLALVLGVVFVGSDLKTRGYMTGTLRVLFGILFSIGVVVCWRVTL